MTQRRPLGVQFFSAAVAVIALLSFSDFARASGDETPSQTLERFFGHPVSLRRPAELGRTQPKAATGVAASFKGHGWWWNPSEPGTWYAFEAQGDKGFFSALAFDPASGAPRWTVSTAVFDGVGYSGRLVESGGGQPLYSLAIGAAQATADVGGVTIRFSENSGTISLSPNSGPTRTVQVVRYPFGGTGPADNSVAVSGKSPEAGYWWNAAQPGRLFIIEAQGDKLFVGSLHYQKPFALDKLFVGTPSNRGYADQPTVYDGNAAGIPIWNTAVLDKTSDGIFML